jgi:hypothetical protein
MKNVLIIFLLACSFMGKAQSTGVKMARTFANEALLKLVKSDIKEVNIEIKD